MDLKISDLPLASAITGTEYAPVIQGGVTKKVLVSGFGSVSTPSNPTSIQYWKDANNVVWKLTMGTDGIFQSQATTAPPTSPGFTYTFPLTLS